MIDYQARAERQDRIVAVINWLAWPVCFVALFAIIGFKATVAAMAAVIISRWLRNA